MKSSECKDFFPLRGVNLASDALTGGIIASGVVRHGCQTLSNPKGCVHGVAVAGSMDHYEPTFGHSVSVH